MTTNRPLPPRRRNGQFKPGRRHGPGASGRPEGLMSDAELAAWAPTCELCGGPNGRLPTGSWGCDKHSDWSGTEGLALPELTL